MEILSLRPHQQEAMDALRQGFREGHTRQLYVAPTGAGKGSYAVALLQAVRDAGNRGVIAMDRIVLCDQLSERLSRYNVPHGVIQAQHWRYRPSEAIQVASVQTLAKRQTLFPPSILIHDEAHSITKSMREYILANPTMKVLGLTATPFTKGMGELFTNIVQTTTTKKLIDDGMLCPLRVYVAREIDMTGAKKVAGEWSSDDVTQRAVVISGDVVSEWIEKTKENFGGPVKTIVFGAGVAHCEDLARRFQDAGHNFVAVSYRDTSEFCDMVYKEFAKADSKIMGLIATDKLSKGFDNELISCMISARPFSKSLSSHIQQIGRGMRGHESKSKCVLICHSGNYLRFRDEWEDIRDNGVSGLHNKHTDKAHSEINEKLKVESSCPECKMLRVRGSLSCAGCGFTFRVLSKVEVVAADMLALEDSMNSLGLKAKKVTMEDKQIFYSGLLEHARIKGYKRGWAANNYREKFGCWPQSILHVEGPIVPAVANWILKKNIAWRMAKR
jgi:superfamily II DNA or RNA helicase